MNYLNVIYSVTISFWTVSEFECWGRSGNGWNIPSTMSKGEELWYLMSGKISCYRFFIGGISFLHKRLLCRQAKSYVPDESLGFTFYPTKDTWSFSFLKCPKPQLRAITDSADPLHRHRDQQNIVVYDHAIVSSYTVSCLSWYFSTSHSSVVWLVGFLGLLSL